MHDKEVYLITTFKVEWSPHDKYVVIIFSKLKNPGFDHRRLIGPPERDLNNMCKNFKTIQCVGKLTN